MAHAIVSSVLKQLASARKQEAKKETEKLQKNLQAIQPVLLKAEERQVRETSVRDWLDQLKQTCYDIEDVLDEWNIHAKLPKKKVSSVVSTSRIVSYQINLITDIVPKLKDLSEKLDNICKRKYMYQLSDFSSHEELDGVRSTKFVDKPEIYGRENEKNLLVHKLCENSERTRHPHILSLVGTGGIGKTTIAKFAYNDNEVITNFDKRIWVDVSNPFDELKMAKSVIEAIKGIVLNVVELGSLLEWISHFVVGKKFLLVLDDMQIKDSEKWKPFYRCLKNGLHGSKILITTRDEVVARMIESTDISTIQKLSEEKCWDLFREFAFFERSPEDCERFGEIGKKIVNKCKGLPLAAKIIGSLLRFKKTKSQWEAILDSDIWTLEESGIDLLPFLLLSYNDLAPAIKQCLAYCAIFPKDYYINKNQLIKLWMAQGYLGLENDEVMEINGHKYLDYLVTRCLLEVFGKDCDGSILYYKMHAIVYKFVQFLSKNEYFTLEINGQKESPTDFSDGKVCHSMLIVSAGASLPVPLLNVKKLRSLMIKYEDKNSEIGEVLPKLFGQMTSLRALDLSGKRWYENLIRKIPREIEKLIHLRYLNLSSLNIKELPEEVCKLYYLETLELSWCTNLKKLPQGMENLINLRHMVNNGTSLSYMPKGIETLTSLQTLGEFIVGFGRDGDSSKACTLESLKDLNQLVSLSITRLGNVTDTNEAKKAELKRKRNLHFLLLNFVKDAGEVRLNADKEENITNKDEEILVALQPPQDIERLEIRDYRGNSMSHDWITSLTRLRMLNLYDCKNIEELPPLGKLPCLESLYICGMRIVKRVGNEFLGKKSGYTSDIAFPKLVSLKFVNMEEWEEWEPMLTVRWQRSTIMPCLRSLSFVHCPKLKKLPDHILLKTQLEELNISWSPILEEHQKEFSHIRNMMINFEDVQRDGH